MLRAFPLLPVLILLAVSGCKGPEPAPGELTEEEEEFVLEVNKRLEEYENARKAGLVEDQRNAQHALQRIADERREVLDRAATCNHWGGRSVALAALGFSLRDDVLATLLKALKDPEPHVRRSALWGLGAHGSDQTPVDQIVAFLADPDAELRLGALFALSKVLRRNRDKGVVPAVLERLGDADWRVRGEAVMVLATIGRRDTIKPIIDKPLKDDAAEVRFRAVGALFAISEADCLDPLIAALTDPDPRVADSAQSALERLTGQKYGKDPAKWDVWWKKRQELGMGLDH